MNDESIINAIIEAVDSMRSHNVKFSGPDIQPYVVEYIDRAELKRILIAMAKINQ